MSKRKFKDITNQRFGMVVAIRRSEKVSRSGFLWECSCDCGVTFTTRGSHLRGGLTKSCGCQNGQKNKCFIRGLSGFRSLFAQYRSRAKTCKYAFTLDGASFLLLTSSPCYYCGIVPTRVRYSSQGNSPYPFNGIDRVDSNSGYELWNCVPCCKECNIAKSGMTPEEFRLWSSRFSSYYVENFGLCA